jgi:hypothetical protein
MTFILPSFGASAISAVPASGGGGGGFNTYSVDFDGTNDYVGVASDPGLDVYSTSLWFKTAETSFSLPIAGFGKNGSQYGGIRFIPSVTGRAVEYNDGTQYIAAGGLSNSDVFDNAWHHVAIVFVASGYQTTTGTSSTDGKGYKIFIDGTRVDTALGSTSHSYSLATTSSFFAVGKERTSYYTGLIDEVAIFGSSLSDSDVTAIYNSGAPADLSSYSPTLWWRMGDNNSGTGTTITDQGSGGNDGTLTNGPTYSSDVPVAPSFTNTYSVDFDGSNDYAEVTGLGLSGATSFSMWFNAQASVGNYPLLHMDTNGLFIDIFSSNLRCILYDNAAGDGSQIYKTNGAMGGISVGTWYHLAVTTNGTSTLKLYVNGVEKGVGSPSTYGSSWSNFNAPSSLPLDIGARTSTNLYANQLIDEVAIFGSELSASDITAIYNSGVPADLASYSPVGWWRMGDNDSGSGTTITDQGSGGNDATLTNGPTFSTTVPS